MRLIQSICANRSKLVKHVKIHEIEFYKETAEKIYKWGKNEQSRARSFVSHPKSVIQPTTSKRLKNHG